jgi:hypothetical protein
MGQPGTAAYPRKFSKYPERNEGHVGLELGAEKGSILPKRPELTNTGEISR